MQPTRPAPMSGGSGSRTRTCLQVFWGDRPATTGGGTKTACGELRLDAQGDAVPHFRHEKTPAGRLPAVFVFLSCVRDRYRMAGTTCRAKPGRPGEAQPSRARPAKPDTPGRRGNDLRLLNRTGCTINKTQLKDERMKLPSRADLQKRTNRELAGMENEIRKEIGNCEEQRRKAYSALEDIRKVQAQRRTRRPNQ